MLDWVTYFQLPIFIQASKGPRIHVNLIGDLNGYRERFHVLGSFHDVLDFIREFDGLTRHAGEFQIMTHCFKIQRLEGACIVCLI